MFGRLEEEAALFLLILRLRLLMNCLYFEGAFCGAVLPSSDAFRGWSSALISGIFSRIDTSMLNLLNFDWIVHQMILNRFLHRILYVLVLILCVCDGKFSFQRDVIVIDTFQMILFIILTSISELARVSENRRIAIQKEEALMPLIWISCSSAE